jgi:hypothetical protein
MTRADGIADRDDGPGLQQPRAWSVKIGVGMPSGESGKSLKRVRPRIRFRIAGSVQRTSKRSGEEIPGD